MDFKEYFNIIYLITLYVIQGLPMGISYSIPFLLQGKISYSEQSLFGMVVLPFSLKLLWAPLVDSVYIEKIGRRKTWIVPTQLLCSILMIIGSYPRFLPTWLCEGIELKDSIDKVTPNVTLITMYFSVLYFLMATQDIAVDAWAVNLLSPRNRGLASTCNIIGQSSGYIISYLGFLFLNDPSISNKYVRPLLGMELIENKPMCEMSQFIYFWGILIFIVTLITTMVKKDDNCISDDVLHKKIDDVDGHLDSDSELTLIEAYSLLYKIIQLKPVILLIILLFIVKIPSAITDSSLEFKLMEFGMKKSDIMLVGPILIPFSIITPFVMTKYVSSGNSPLKILNYILPLKLLLSTLFCLLLIWSRFLYEPWVKKEIMDTPNSLYYTYIVLSIFSSILCDTQSLVFMTLFNIVSDVRFAGTYITLFNTINNLGCKWPASLSVWLLDYTNVNYCGFLFNYIGFLPKTFFNLFGNHCIIDSFFVQFCFCFVFGIFGTMFIYPSIIRKIESFNSRDWIVKDICINKSTLEKKNK
ncbi:Acetyl-coenzyme A transporter 1 [Cryptosporidium felis]|nr:Acetyl-coenzyme A transporter 1 [Cryptosporidium felis]